MWNKKVDELHMKTKCPKQHGRFPGKEDHWYAPRPKIKPHLKNVWQSPKNPLRRPNPQAIYDQSANLKNIYT
jgi:hypothetical protein